MYFQMQKKIPKTKQCSTNTKQRTNRNFVANYKSTPVVNGPALIGGCRYLHIELYERFWGGGRDPPSEHATAITRAFAKTLNNTCTPTSLIKAKTFFCKKNFYDKLFVIIDCNKWVIIPGYWEVTNVIINFMFTTVLRYFCAISCKQQCAQSEKKKQNPNK